MEIVDPLRTARSSLLDLVNPGADFPLKMVVRVLITVDDAPATEDLRSKDKGRGDGDPFGSQNGQIVSFTPQMNEVIGQRVRMVDGTTDFFGVIGHQQVEVRLVQGLLLLGESQLNPGEEMIQVLQAKGAGDEVPEKPLADAVDEVARGDFIAREVLGQKVLPAHLTDQVVEVILVGIYVVDGNNVFDPIGEPPENVQVLREAEALNLQ